MIDALRRLISDDRGATLVEYGLLLMLIALVCIGALVVIGTSVKNMYSNASNEL